jgi:hypothetical protein
MAFTVTSCTLMVAPAYLRMAAMLDIPVVETFFCTAAGYCVDRALRRESLKTWVVAGLFAGLALLTKHTVDAHAEYYAAFANNHHSQSVANQQADETSFDAFGQRGHGVDSVLKARSRKCKHHVERTLDVA